MLVISTDISPGHYLASLSIFPMETNDARRPAISKNYVVIAELTFFLYLIPPVPVLFKEIYPGHDALKLPV